VESILIIEKADAFSAAFLAFSKDGTATEAITPMMTTTRSNSTNENPL
jgi:hypothetical protein